MFAYRELALCLLTGANVYAKSLISVYSHGVGIVLKPGIQWINSLMVPNSNATLEERVVWSGHGGQLS